MFRSISKLVPAAIFPALVLTALVGWCFGVSLDAQDVNPPRPAPEFTQTDPSAWINSKPLTLEDLRGKVVLLDFWTFECWNCYRSFPWLTSLAARFEGDGLQVIGVHTPEFADERVKSNVVAKTEEFGLQYPVMMDNDFAYWNAMNNQFWPAVYLLDKQGRVRATFIGETHTGDAQADEVESAIERLLAEKA